MRTWIVAVCCLLLGSGVTLAVQATQGRDCHTYHDSMVELAGTANADQAAHRFDQVVTDETILWHLAATDPCAAGIDRAKGLTWLEGHR